MINVSMTSWLQDVHGFMSRVRRRNRLTAIAADDRQKMMEGRTIITIRQVCVIDNIEWYITKELEEVRFMASSLKPYFKPNLCSNISDRWEYLDL